MDGEKIVGEYILLHTRPFTAEIVNIAVAAPYRNHGIGKMLIGHAKDQARVDGFRILTIATGNCGIGQIALYQKCGFTITHIDYDYITRLYPQPIIENGIECRDMVHLSIYL
ncbi:MAG: GNAT family N-acetyltransferase [Alistipes sp.]|nr:GNAT family N-acetyltransferase [Alistipes sp.]